MLNENIIKWFELLIKQTEFYSDVKTGKDKLAYAYKVNNFKKALATIKRFKNEIKSGEHLRSSVGKNKGIGQGTMDRIDEIIKTGKLSEVNDADISGKHLEYVENIMKIFGIGRVKAYELYTKHGIKNVDDLKKAIKKGTIDLPEYIMKGLKYVDKIKRGIPRATMHEINKYLIKQGIKQDPEMEVRVCGSYRREKDVSNDIDVIISHPKIITKEEAENSDLLRNFIKRLKKDKFIVDSFTSPDVPTKYMGVCKLDGDELRRIDIRYMPQESYYTAIMYFTGSREFNTRLRNIAKSMDYKLNEYALINNKNNKRFEIKGEKDIFDKLGLEYVQPKDRY